MTQALGNMLQASARIDRALGFKWRPDKGEVFGAGAMSRAALVDLAEEWKLKVVTDFKLLGIHYFMDRQRHTPCDPARKSNSGCTKLASRRGPSGRGAD
eukprot:4453185-Heterocapsa_arctica.AAC.1